jgi:hypothetical protein
MNRGDICKAILSVFCVANICFLTACKDEDVVKSVDGRVPFCPVAGCEGGTRLNGTTWETGDQIGVFAYNNEGALVSDVNANVRFLVNPQNNSCTAAHADSTIWLSNDETYSVVAYYPYSTTYVQNIPVQGVDQPGGGTSYEPAYVINDWADQSDLSRLDLLWTSKSVITAYDADVSLQFAHQFSRVQINFTIDTEASSLTADSLVGMKVKLSGKNFLTLFDLKTGELSFGPMNQDSISFNVTHEENATTATAAAIVVPDAESSTSETRSITVLLPNDGNRTFKFDVPSEIAFEKGKFYVWNVTFNTDATLSTNSFYVSASGNDSNTGKKDSPLATIAGAIAKMNNPDADYTIFIDGKVIGSQTIASNFTLEKAKSVTIKGANGLDPTNYNVPQDTLDGNRSGSVVKIQSNVPVTFQNIMLINGRAQNGAGIYINDYSADVTVEDGTIIRDCLAEEKGGGIYANGNLTVTGGTISRDTASWGGGIFVDLFDDRFKVSIGGTVKISLNVADSYGGGICLDGYCGQPVMLSGSANVNRNYCVDKGGGVALLEASMLIMSDDAEITDNNALNYGGGVYLEDDSDYGGAQLVMTGGTIYTNSLIAGNSHGKGVYAQEGTAITMGGAARIASENDVYLDGEANNAKIYIGSLLTAEAPVATITLGDNVADLPTVLTTGQFYVDGNWVDATTTVAANYTKFAISGNTGIINQDGVYYAAIDIDGVVSQITSMTESGTVSISGYANEPDALIEAISEALKTLHDENQSVLVKLDMSGVMGITTIGEDAFRECVALQGIVIPEGVKKLDSGAFLVCSKLEEISLPSTLTYIGDGVFYNDISLTAISIPSSVDTLGTEIFYSCSSLASVTLPEGLDSIGSWFEGCESLTSLTIPSTVTKLSNYSFGTCGLTSCTIPSGVVKLPKDLFQSCESLVSVVLPAGLATIEQDAFWGCSSLSTIYYMGTEAQHAAMDIQDAIVSSSQVTWVYNYDPNASGGNGAQGFVTVNGGTLPYESDYYVGTMENDHTQTEIIIPDLLVSSQLVTQYEYEQLMTYYGAVNSEYATYKPTETSESAKQNTPAYYVSWVDAIIYCNLRSLAEGLTPVYSIQDETDPTAAGSPWTAYYNVAKDANNKYYYDVIPDNYDATSSWDLDAGAFNYDLSADGYRLPTSSEYIWILEKNPDLITGSYNEWCHNYFYDYRRVWYKASEHTPTNEEMYAINRSADMGFRVVRNGSGNGNGTPSYIGTQQPGATLSVGDVVFNDGSSMPYSSTMSLSDTQKAAAVAVIFDASAKKGVGLVQGTGMKWATADAVIYSDNNFAQILAAESSDSDGSLNNYSITDEMTYYPAWNWAINYSSDNLTSEYRTGWYFPAKDEVSTLMSNKTVVSNALQAAGGAGIDGNYWTSTLDTDGLPFSYYNGSMGAMAGYTSTFNVRAIRQF